MIKVSLYFIVIGIFIALALLGIQMLFFSVNNHEMVSTLPKSAWIASIYVTMYVVVLYLMPISTWLFISSFLHIPRIQPIVLKAYTYIIGSLIFSLSILNIFYFKYTGSHLAWVTFQWLSAPNDVFQLIVWDKYTKLSLLCCISLPIILVQIHNRVYKLLPKLYHQRTFLGIWMIGLTLYYGFGSPIDYLNGNKQIHSNNFFAAASLQPIYLLYADLVCSKVDPNPNQIIRFQQEIVNYNQNFSPHKMLNQSNIVLILMESMAMHNLQQGENEKYITPFLNNLAKNSIQFSNMYSTGEHTYNGILSCLYAHQPNIGVHSVTENIGKKITGLPNLLQKNHYFTSFHVSHDKGFDQLNRFILGHGFNLFTGYEDMPSKWKGENCWGVPDKYLFSYVLDILDTISRHKNPFFCTILTLSNHSPFVIPNHTPKWIKALSKSDAAIAYADYALMDFFNNAKYKPWFNNTLFIFIGDHGTPKNTYPMMALNLNHHHVACMMYHRNLRPKKIDRLASQIDIYSTISSMLGLIPSPNAGIDVLNNQRKDLLLMNDLNLGLLDTSGNLFLQSKFGATYFYRRLGNTWVNKNQKNINFNELWEKLVATRKLAYN